MAEDKLVTERPVVHITVEINQISSELHEKVKTAVQEVVNKIKEKHLS
jgi:hypothetical protein